MGKPSRDKGGRGEREVAAIFQAHGFDCERVPNSGALRIKGDLYGTLPVHVEVKRQERIQLPAWLRQAAEEAPEGFPPLVAFRQNGEQWYGAAPLPFLVALLAVADAARALCELEDVNPADPDEHLRRLRAAVWALDHEPVGEAV